MKGSIYEETHTKILKDTVKSLFVTTLLRHSRKWWNDPNPTQLLSCYGKYVKQIQTS